MKVRLFEVLLRAVSLRTAARNAYLIKLHSTLNDIQKRELPVHNFLRWIQQDIEFVDQQPFLRFQNLSQMEIDLGIHIRKRMLNLPEAEWTQSAVYAYAVYET